MRLQLFKLEPHFYITARLERSVISMARGFTDAGTLWFFH
jgi:hypothetical protein